MPTIEGRITDITFRNEENGWTVLRLSSGRQRITAVGVLPFVGEGEKLKLTGEWKQHPEYGAQLQVTECESIRPETRSDIEKYLASGLVKGIGPATAKLIMEYFGKQALEVIERDPQRLIEIPGIGSKRAKMIGDSFAQQQGMRRMMIFLQKYRLSVPMCMRIYKRFGEATERIIRENPYRLVDDVEGIGFLTADEIAFASGVSPESDFRLQSGLKYVLNQAAEMSGHMFLPRETLMEEAQRLLRLDESLVERAAAQLTMHGELVETPMGEWTAVYLRSLYKAEREVADRMMLLVHTAPGSRGHVEDAIRAYERAEKVQLSADQKEAAESACANGALVITGGPGTGKTTVIRCLIRVLASEGQIALAAPTGRAARRMTEATGVPAQTIHRLLECGGDSGEFQRNEDNPLEADVIIIDEMSMVDIRLMKSLLAAVKPGSRLILVGDADQLPSVGAGRVLGDIIESGVIRVVRLTEIFRQAQKSMIVQNAHRINRGEPPLVNSKDTDFFLERKNTIQDTAQTVVDLISRRLPGYTRLDPLRDMQVLSPMKKGDIGVWQMNKLLQDAMNPPGPGIPERKRGDVVFRLGDKVMQIRNDYQMAWSRGIEENQGVFNGDMGFITGVDEEENTVEVTFDDDRVCIYDDSGLDDLELAYCVSVHKSQGSEFPVVVMPLFNGPAMLMTRNLLYTAVTRAKKMVVTVGRESCIQSMVGNHRQVQRYSALDMRLKEAGERFNL